MTVPDDLLYTAEHEWIRVEGDEIVVGVTEFAQGELGDPRKKSDFYACI